MSDSFIITLLAVTPLFILNIFGKGRDLPYFTDVDTEAHIYYITNKW